MGTTFIPGGIERLPENGGLEAYRLAFKASDSAAGSERWEFRVEVRVSRRLVDIWKRIVSDPGPQIIENVKRKLHELRAVRGVPQPNETIVLEPLKQENGVAYDPGNLDPEGPFSL